MQAELPNVLAACEDVTRVSICKWWKAHEGTFPIWTAVLKKCLLVQPSSAAAQRVLSLLENSFSKNQAKALEDYIEGSLMLQYNHKSDAEDVELMDV